MSQGTSESTGIQVLTAIKVSNLAVQTKVMTIAIDVNLLRADLRKVAERTVETETNVTELREEISVLNTAVAALKVHSSRLEARMEDAEGDRNVWTVSYPMRFLSDHAQLLLECRAGDRHPPLAAAYGGAGRLRVRH
ncbi:hypothetical protein NDU88_005438 [Pleurodeles waltl]|uniref:Uncharacterized protein n=1 Tax=Pleurodeles waltl TaxID=8319 RepID=A0AAV7MCX2_PLEWA|nr:hypothetical protein NDU88_005438 [Pleurodeles waltl]